MASSDAPSRPGSPIKRLSERADQRIRDVDRLSHQIVDLDAAPPVVAAAAAAAGMPLRPPVNAFPEQETTAKFEVMLECKVLRTRARDELDSGRRIGI